MLCYEPPYCTNFLRRTKVAFDAFTWMVLSIYPFLAHQLESSGTRVGPREMVGERKTTRTVFSGQWKLTV